MHSADGIEQIEVDCSDDLYHINVRAFVDAIQGKGRPTATGTDGLGALQVAVRLRSRSEPAKPLLLTTSDKPVLILLNGPANSARLRPASSP